MSREKDELRRKLREEIQAQNLADSTGSLYLPVGIQNKQTIPSISPDIRAELSEAATVFAYLALPSEPDVSPLIELALSGGATVLAPRMDGDGLSFFPIESSSGPFDVGPYGIREPPATRPPAWPGSAIDVPAIILVPGLAFSPEGTRLGRGKGYYDRFLSSLLSNYVTRRNGIKIVGICAPERVRAYVPSEPHDIPVDCLWTEKDGIFGVY